MDRVYTRDEINDAFRHAVENAPRDPTGDPARLAFWYLVGWFDIPKTITAPLGGTNK